jgi:hypothetical protein
MLNTKNCELGDQIVRRVREGAVEQSALEWLVRARAVQRAGRITERPAALGLVISHAG